MEARELGEEEVEELIEYEEKIEGLNLDTHSPPQTRNIHSLQDLLGSLQSQLSN